VTESLIDLQELILPGGHVDFDSGNLGLMKDLSRKILVVKVLPASLGPEEVKDEATEDVKRLPDVGEAPDMVFVETRWVVLALENTFAQQDEGPRRGDLV
jgi:hypothetical protein